MILIDVWDVVDDCEDGDARLGVVPGVCEAEGQ